MTYENQSIVSGEIFFEGDIRPFKNATVFVSIEDVSIQDLPSLTISKQVLENVDYDPSKMNKIKFSLPVPIKDLTGWYIVKVLVDIDGDGEISKGDYITMAYYHVLTHGHPNHVLVRVKQVE